MISRANGAPTQVSLSLVAGETRGEVGRDELTPYRKAHVISNSHIVLVSRHLA
jgi:hypothetical protein